MERGSANPGLLTLFLWWGSPHDGSPLDSPYCSSAKKASSVAFRSELVKKWGLAPSACVYDRENHANARCLSPFFHKLSGKEACFLTGSLHVKPVVWRW